MNTKESPIYNGAKVYLNDICTAKGLNDKTLAVEELLRRIKMQEQFYRVRIDMLEKAVKHGNKLFDFFSDIYINEAVTRDVKFELMALQDYLDAIRKNHTAPRSSAMDVIHEDQLLKVS